jgi:4'-phosphopantetheinyl transferase
MNKDLIGAIADFAPRGLSEPVHLVAKEAHLWLIPIAGTAAAIEAMEALLCDEEWARAARFMREADRRRHIVSHGSMRRILSAYTGIPAVALRFGETIDHKPFLLPEHDETPCFNLSHSGDYALLGVTRKTPIGVDIEAERRMPDLERIALKTFGAGEIAGLAGLRTDRREAGFFACWTRKEAFVKALGSGLAFKLDRFEVSIDPDRPARLLSVDGSERSAADYSMMGSRFAPGYFGAAVVCGAGFAMRLLRYDRPACET